jgi:TorA maturation chaperone TorD
MITKELSQEKLLVKADIYRGLSLGLAYPDEKNQTGAGNIFRSLIDHDEVDGETVKILKKLLQYQNDPLLLKEYSRLFMKGNVPMSEAGCCARMHSTTDVSAFYKAFGVTPKSGESPDSIIYQLEFAALMIVKTLVAGNEDDRFVTTDAYKKFMDDHLVEFAEKFTEKLLETKPIPYYVAITELMKKWIG